MLAIPENANRLRIISLDPGTSTTGLACFDFDLVTMRIELVEALTIKASTNFGKYKQISINQGDRLARILNICDAVYHYLLAFRPHMVISEAPYMGRFPDAFEGLVHCVSILELMVMKYNFNSPLEMIDPTTVKRNVNAILRGEESKNSVREKILELADNQAFFTNINLPTLDEHAIDSIAVGWYKITKLIEGFYGIRYHHHKNTYRSFDCRTLDYR